VPDALGAPTTLDLVRDVLFRAGEPTTVQSDFYQRALEALNRAQLVVAAGGQEFDPAITEAWRWHRSVRPAVLIVPPPDGVTLACTFGSTQAQVDPATPLDADTEWVGSTFWSCQTGTRPRVAAITADRTVLTWDAPWIEPTGEYSGALQIWDAVLPDTVLRVLDPLRITCQSSPMRPYEVSGIGQLVLERQWPPLTQCPGFPEAYTMVGTRTLRFNRPPEVWMRVEVEHMTVPPALTDSELSVPREPPEYRYVLADIALYYLMVDRDDNRAQGMAMQARSRLQAMVRRERTMQQQIASDYAHLRPRVPAWTAGVGW
jgi:hypothetical protein